MRVGGVGAVFAVAFDRVTELILRKLRDERRLIADQLLDIPVSDHAAYRESVGRAAGLKLAADIIESVHRGDEEES